MLPAKLRWQSRETTYLRPVAVEHPALRELGELADAAPWSEFPVFKYWELEAGTEPANVVATFANGKPALVERQIGGGRVLMMTTSVSDPAHDDPWNLLPTAPDPWPFLALANGIAQYLAGAGQSQLNYLAGQTIVLPLAPEEQVSSYVLQLPDSQRGPAIADTGSARSFHRGHRSARQLSGAGGRPAGTARSGVQREPAGGSESIGARRAVRARQRRWEANARASHALARRSKCASAWAASGANCFPR